MDCCMVRLRWTSTHCVKLQHMQFVGLYVFVVPFTPRHSCDSGATRALRLSLSYMVGVFVYECAFIFPIRVWQVAAAAKAFFFISYTSRCINEIHSRFFLQLVCDCISIWCFVRVWSTECDGKFQFVLFSFLFVGFRYLWCIQRKAKIPVPKQW